jgi:uncharacterized damage-inducible protein DinB
MNRKEIVLHLWDTAYDIEGWHPPLKDAVKGIDHAAALWRPNADAHNIWELVNHLICYKDRFLCRLEGNEFDPAITDNEVTFQRGIGKTETEGQQRIAHLEQVQQSIKSNISGIADSDVDKPLPESALGMQILSLASHDSYHTGQIMFIRKLQRSWPNHRLV